MKDRAIKFMVSWDLKLYNRRVYESEIPNVKLPSGSNMCGYDTNGPRILCTVFTHKKSFNLKAQYVDKTWGKRCDKTIFMSGNKKGFQSTANLIHPNDFVWISLGFRFGF